MRSHLTNQRLTRKVYFLLKENIKGWHLLRLYIRGECLGSLVKSLGDLVWETIESSYEQFLDSKTQTVRVATPQEFVGRRRELQRCLKALRTPNTLGVLVCGLGGIGKSTVAVRLLEWLIGYEQIFIYRGFDEDKLLRLLAEQCISETGLEILQGKLPLMQRLTKFLQQGLNKPEQRFVFVLDDFEANLELRADRLQVLKADVVEVLMYLLRAIIRSRLPHRVIITCRYDLVLPEENHRLYRESLTTLKGVDLRKKYDRLTSFSGKIDIDSDLK
ncbi:ATP-binding protein [Nostoc sp. C052]|uniref:ATP-binding protein n=1 Tax=Nostoc sp. C052 TaxID=2576902 RepID=UPI002118ED21|nr:ATP-binding protein [Nostoc sp. C052]